MDRYRLFTTAFRKVSEQTFGASSSASALAGSSALLMGNRVPIALIDKGGTPLASGLYYVVVTNGKDRKVGKLLILR